MFEACLVANWCLPSNQLQGGNKEIKNSIESTTDNEK